MAYDTALNIIADAAVELGLVSFANKPTDVFGSQDPNIGLLCQLLKSVGRDLMRCHQWTNLQGLWLFSTGANNATYQMPGDFDRVIDQTAWNRTVRLPVGGPISPQTYEFLSSRLQGVTWNLLWRMLQGKFHVYPDISTPGSQVISFEYMSRWWVVPAATRAQSSNLMWLPGYAFDSGDYAVSGGNVYTCTQTGTSSTTAAISGTSSGIVDGTCTWNYVSAAGTDSPTANADVIQFDPQLAQAALELAYKQTRGHDTTGVAMDYKSALERAISADTAAPVLNFGRHNFAEPLLGPWNLPTSGQ